MGGLGDRYRETLTESDRGNDEPEILAFLGSRAQGDGGVADEGDFVGGIIGQDSGGGAVQRHRDCRFSR